MSDKISFPWVPNWRDSPQAAAIHKAYDTCGFDGLTHRQVEVVLDALDVGGFLAPPAALSTPSEPVPDGPRVLGYIVATKGADGSWHDDWDGEVHADLATGRAALAACRDFGCESTLVELHEVVEGATP